MILLYYLALNPDQLAKQIPTFSTPWVENVLNDPTIDSDHKDRLRDYLAQLNILYDEWISHFSLCPVLMVPADNLDYVSNHGHMDLIVSKIQEKLIGKEEVIFAPEEVAK